jgi:CBS domain-containing protein
MSADSITVSAFMTLDPCAVDEDLTLDDAADRMRANNIRHLLVLRDGHLIGVVSSRDLAFAQAVSEDSAAQTMVRAAARPALRTCLPDCPLAEVALDMEANHLDCVVVVDTEGNAKGIFTLVDALQALRTLLAGHSVAPQVVPTHKHTGASIGDTQMRVRVKRILRRAGASPSPNDGMAFGRGGGL